MKKFRKSITIFILFIIYIYVANISLIPDKIIIIDNEEYKIKKFFGVTTSEIVRTSSDSENNNIEVEINLFGNRVKTVNIEKIENVEIVPLGKIIGLKLYTNGVMIVGMSQVENIDNELVSPFVNSDIKEGDTILKINDEEIDSIDNLKNVVNNSNGNNLTLTLKRDETIFTSNIIPAQTEDDEYKLGLWVKDAATGVGTITYYEKNTNYFGAIGHGIYDSDTDKLIEIDSGEIVTADVISISKADINSPGEIRGKITNQKNIGKVTKNTKFGIFGVLNDLTLLNINTENTIKLASRDEIQIGDAKIMCSLDGKTTKEYNILIEKIYTNNNYDNKSMLIKINDDELMELTGGIIRGLSGAPIIQNGKFIGCVTNVLVSNPEIGYGIFGDMMIKEMRK